MQFCIIMLLFFIFTLSLTSLGNILLLSVRYMVHCEQSTSKATIMKCIKKDVVSINYLYEYVRRSMMQSDQFENP